MILRSLSFAALLLAPLAPAIASDAAAPVDRGAITKKQLKKCERLNAEFARTGKIVKMYRAYTGEDGESKIEVVDIKGVDGVFYGGKVSLTQYPLGDPSNVELVYGHPNMEIPPHPSPYREIFMIISGSSTTYLADGSEYELTPGTLLLTEDQGSRIGRGGRSGPCGYVMVDFQYKKPPVAAAPVAAAAAPAVKK